MRENLDQHTELSNGEQSPTDPSKSKDGQLEAAFAQATEDHAVRFVVRRIAGGALNGGEEGLLEGRHRSRGRRE